MKLAFVAAAALCLLEGGEFAEGVGTRVLIDRAKVRQLAKDVGITSLLEREGVNMAVGAGTEQQNTAQHMMEVPSLGATSSEVQSGDFEIKCATSCDFVKKGTAEFLDSPFGAQTNSAGSSAVQAAQYLEELYLKMAKMQDQLAQNPTDASLVEQRQKLQAKINSQVALLNAVAGGGALEAPVSPNDERTVEALQAKLEALQARLADNPDDANLQALRSQYKNEIESRQRAIAAQKTLQSKREEVATEISKLTIELEKLQASAGSAPNDATLQKQIQDVTAQIEELKNQQGSMNPSEQCAKVCAKPASSTTSGDQNCVRTCVKTLRVVAYKLAKTFF